MESGSQPDGEPGWHISKTVNITVLIGIAIQTAAIIWGAAKLDSRVESIEKWMMQNSNTQVALVEMQARNQQQDYRLDRLEVRK